jgi:hypothetical protein
MSAALLGAYLLVGVGVALVLQRRAEPPGAVLGALLAWPLLVPLLKRPPRPPRGRDGERIDRALDALLETLADPAAAEIGWTDDLTGLRTALHRVDARLTLVDRLLHEQPDAPSAAALEQARTAARGDIDRVLGEVTELRVQVGLVTLAGDGARLRDRLRDLSARAAALDEVSMGRARDDLKRPV